ncbi:head-tail connector protein [Aneurinibacillus thermoaerophilus]|uniref:head-tail connector protein n=1 Tax=Aneurinibacillus thermoaerophilus TaxID=143495 RepID=UPI001C31E12E|nr:head-tail connector protein [Aneurinibacillus thermoaerophilus]
MRLVIPPLAEPLSLEEAKMHLRVEYDDEDAMIQSLIRAAREYCENFQRRAYVSQVWELYLDTFPAQIELPRPPLLSVEAITYRDAKGEQHTLSPDAYIIDAATEPGRVFITSAPKIALFPASPVTIRFVAGYEPVITDGNTDYAAGVPDAVKQAMRLLIGHWYENREAVTIGQMPTAVPFSVEALLWQDRVF